MWALNSSIACKSCRHHANLVKQAQSQSTTDAKNCKCIPHEFCIKDKVLIHCDLGNPYLGKLAKPTQGPFKIIDVQQLPINGTILIQRSPTSVQRINICRLLPFFEHYNWGCKCCTSVIMTWLLVMKGLNQLFYHTIITKHEHDKWLWPTHTLIHDVTTKYPKPAKPQRLSICNLFHKQISFTWQPQKSL
jgi:hypothetical protein